MMLPVSAYTQEINTKLMETTFKIQGPAREKNKISLGTVFILGKRSKTETKVGDIVLITAAHVLEDIQGDKAILVLRKKEIDGQYTKRLYTVSIRKGEKQLWYHHPDPKIDVAAMYIALPDDLGITVISTELLADDSLFSKFEIHPGDELLSLGFPLGAEANPAGFPILRSGKIASYPLTPASKCRSFLFDFSIFKGNSGGPVYCYYQSRKYGGEIHLDLTIQAIVGLVTEQAFSTAFPDQPLQLAVVIPAQFIKETIASLPESK